MKPFVNVEGVAAPLPVDNIDTDAIIPSRETQSVVRSGYGEKLFANWRYAPGTRAINPDFVLNKPPFDRAVILLTGTNFGCGSSREAAVWALVQFGVRAVIAPSFGAIFYNNCIRNGLLPVILDQEHVSSLLHAVEVRPETTIRVHLESQDVILQDMRFAFEIASRDREMLLSGADEIELTLRSLDQINDFRERDRLERPWLYKESNDGRAD